VETVVATYDTNIIDINDAAKAKGAFTWPAIKRTMITPAFRLCSSMLEAADIVPEYCENNEYHLRPFFILFWVGRGSLANTRVGLHFTYGGDRMQFNLSAVRDDVAQKIRYQTAFHTEQFNTCTQNLGGRILALSSFGLGKALQMDLHPLPKTEWRTSNLPLYVN
jgi:hypothetical protein